MVGRQTTAARERVRKGQRLATDISAPDARREGRVARLRTMTEQEGAVRLGDAAQTLGVSSMTLRRDLAEGTSGLDLLGGYIVARNRQPAAKPYALQSEQDVHVRAKAEAGRRAAALVQPGDTIFIDCGTTMPHLVAGLDPELDITIICYALNIAAAVCQMSRAQIVMLGGVFHRPSATFFSEEAMLSLQRIGINKAFLSAGGLHDKHGATCSNFNEVPVKRAVLDRAVSAFLVMDSSKIGQVKPAHFAPGSAFDSVVTETS
jgi:DeoR family deoxyribose operon repressor